MEHEQKLDGLVEPTKGGAVKKGMYVLLGGKPCVVISKSVSKTGKHGHAKCKFKGEHIFTKKKIEAIESSSHYMNCPFVYKKDYLVYGMDEEGYLTLIDLQDDSQRQDLALPKDECYEKLRTDFMKDWDDEKTLQVTVTKCMNIEMIQKYQLDTEKD